MNMKRFLLSILCCLLAVVSGYAEEATATLTFDNTSKRTTYTKSQQVWEENGITLTNNKAASTTDVANYAKPARFYASSSIELTYSGKITKIVFDCNNSGYATALSNSIGSTATTSVSSDKVTVTLDGSSDSFTIEKLTAQVRMDAVTVTYEDTGSEVSKPATPTLTAGGNFIGSMEVEISCATGDAVIYYTTDGTEPTEESESYSGAFEITETKTVKAIAVNEAGASNVATAEYTRVAATPVINFEDATFEESVAVTITTEEGTTAYYTLNGKTPNEDSDEFPETLTLKADATLQVIAYDEDGYASPVVKQAFKLTSSGASGSGTTATLVTDASTLQENDKVVIVASGYDYALSTTQNTNNRGAVAITKNDNDTSIELNGDVQIFTLENGVDGTFAFKTEIGYLYAASSSSNNLKTKEQLDTNGNANWKVSVDVSGSASIVAKGTYTRNVLRFNNSNSPKLFSCYAIDKASNQQDVSLYKVNLSTVEDYDLNVSAAGWATLYLGYNTVIPEGVKCYAVSSVGDGKVTLTEIEGNNLPANTGVIVKAEEGNYTFAVTEEAADEVESLLLGTTKNEYIDNEAYVLGKVEGVVGLYKAEMAGGVFLNNANKAYLPASEVPEVQGANGLKFRFETTGIEGVQVAQGKKVIFDLSGRKVSDMTAPGVYIVNGKKVLVK